MGIDEGYIGISSNPKARWSRHKSENSDSNWLLKRAIKKHSPDFKIVACFDKLEDALWQEFTLRPFDRMGWNLIKGGGLPPDMGGWNKGKKTPDEIKNKLSKARQGRFAGHEHPRSRPANIYDADTNEVIAENVIIRNWALNNGYHQGHLAATALGNLKKHKGVYARYVDTVQRPRIEEPS